MAVPKKKHSKSRRNRRRSQWKATAPSLVECTNCHQMKLSHRVCQHCGFYSDRQVKAAQ